MTDITLEEANKIIAEFMGHCLHWYGPVGAKCSTCGKLIVREKDQLYGASLDALMPVLKKLNAHWIRINLKGHTFKSSVTICIHVEITHSDDNLSEEESACICVAKAILELGGRG